MAGELSGGVQDEWEQYIHEPAPHPSRRRAVALRHAKQHAADAAVGLLVFCTILASFLGGLFLGRLS